MDRARYHIQRLATRALDPRRIEVVMSNETPTRDGDIVRVDGWQLENFLKHPILLSSHNYSALTSQIGEWEDVAKRSRDGAKALIGVANYYVGEGNEEADWGYRLAEKGMAAYSVGFLPDMSKAKEIGNAGWRPLFEFTRQELLECSHVTVPNNPDTLQRLQQLSLHPAMADIVNDLLQDAPPTVSTNEAPPSLEPETLALQIASFLWPQLEATLQRIEAQRIRDVNLNQFRETLRMLVSERS